MRPRIAVPVLLVLAAGFCCWWWSEPREPGAPAAGPVARAPEAAPRSASAGHGRREAVDEPGPAATAPSTATAPEDAVGRLLVLVVGEAGLAVPGCKVTSVASTSVTAANGRAELTLPARRQYVQIEPPEGEALLGTSGWQTVLAERVTEVRVVLAAKRVYAFCCRLLAEEDGRPLAGVVLSGPGLAAEVTSDARGHAQVVVHAASEWIDASRAGRARRRILPEPGHDSEPQAMPVPLAAEATLAVAVADAAGAPLGDVPVRVAASAWTLQWPAGARPRGPECEWKTATDARGVAAFTGLPAGTLLELGASAPPPYSTVPAARWSLAPGPNERRIVLEAPGAVRGRVLDGAARPLAGVVVRALAAERPTTPRAVAGFHSSRPGLDAPPTDAAGEFAFPALAPGTWWLGLARDPSRVAVIERVELAPGARADVTLRVRQGLAVAGRAVTPSGAPAAGLVVNALVDDDYLMSCRTDAAGRFRMAPLPTGSCELTLDPYEGDLDLARPVSVAAGTEDVELRLEAVRGSIAGRVEPASDAWVMLMRRGGDDQISNRCDLDGTFRYPGLAAGVWDVHAMDRAGNVACSLGVRVAGGRVTAGLELVLASGGRILVQDEDADEFLVLRGEEVAYRDALPGGAIGEALVPPGKWTVVLLRAGRERMRREVTVRAGESVRAGA